MQVQTTFQCTLERRNPSRLRSTILVGCGSMAATGLAVCAHLPHQHTVRAHAALTLARVCRRVLKLDTYHVACQWHRLAFLVS
jgi:hypothetical protein